MTYYILKSIDLSSNEEDEIKILVSTINIEVLKISIEEYQEMRFKREAWIIDVFGGFIEFLHEKGINGKLLNSEEVILETYDSS